MSWVAQRRERCGGTEHDSFEDAVREGQLLCGEDQRLLGLPWGWSIPVGGNRDFDRYL